MRFVFTVFVGLIAFPAAMISPVLALPTTMPGASVQSNAESNIDEARTYCYNRYTGRFKHWGACERHPRVYCYNRYTGQFKHWGSCY